MGDCDSGKIAEEIDLLEYTSEDDQAAKTRLKGGAMDLLKRHIKEQRGSPNLANRVLKKGDGEGDIVCTILYWWFDIAQDDEGKPNIEEYPRNNGNLVWEDQAVNWTDALRTVISAKGDITDEGINRLFNGDMNRFPEHLLKLAQAKIWKIPAEWKRNLPPTQGKLRPSLGVDDVRIARCECRFTDARNYNDHMRSIHGVQTNLALLPAPSIPIPPPVNPTNLDPMQAMVIPLIQKMSSTHEKYITQRQMNPRPGKREVREGKIKEFFQALKSAGRYDESKEEQVKDSHTVIIDRLK